MSDVEKVFREVIRSQLESHGVSYEVCNKIDVLLIQDLAPDEVVKEPIYDISLIYSTKVTEHCYKRARWPLTGDVHEQYMVVDDLPVDIMKGNWQSIMISSSPPQCWVYHNRQKLATHQIKQIIKHKDVVGLPTFTDDDLIRIDGTGYPLEEIQTKPFIGYYLSRGGYIRTVGRYRLPKHLENKIINEKII